MAMVNANMNPSPMTYSLSSLCANPMTRESFLSWKNQLEAVVLRHHKYLGYIRGTVATFSACLEDGTVNLEYEKHIEIDEVILSWIRATVSSSIQTLIIQCLCP